jgi:dihydropteroate synthase
LRAGADVLNDVTGLSGGEAMYAAAKLAKGFVLMAHPERGSTPSHPIGTVRRILEDDLARAVGFGIPRDRIVVDPGIGFFRNTRLDWWRWDLAILRDLKELASLNAPILVGVSRKSFVSQVLQGKAPEDRLNGSLGATVAAVMNGAAIVRTHDVAATREAVQVAQAIMVERIAFRTPAPVERPGRGTKRKATARK